MKRQYLLTALACLFMVVGLQAQERYLDEVFTDVQVTEDVQYGRNVTLLTLSTDGVALPEALLMDVYEPMADTETNRPLVVVMHTGNFLPNVTNGQISGTKKDSAVVEICTQLARKGYVAAAITYRKGWNPFAETQQNRATGLIQAAYRGVQDGRTAVKYFRRSVAESGNPFGIDPTRVTAWGNGTGGYIALAMASLDTYEEILTTTAPPAKFILDLLDANGNPIDSLNPSDGVPETPMVLQAFHGDVNADSTAIAPISAFFYQQGDTSSIANHVGYSGEISLALNIGGSLGDISWLDENTVPIVTVHSALDDFAPFADGFVVVPTTGDVVVQVQGGALVHARQNELGNHAMLNEAIFADDQTVIATESTESAASQLGIDLPYREALYPYVLPANSFGRDEGVAIDWWDPAAPSPADGAGMGIPWNMLPHPSGAGSYHEVGLVLNEGMSAEKAKGNIANVMNYFSPRACVVLDLPCASMFTSVEDIDLGAGYLNVSPNPAHDYVNVTSDKADIQSIVMYSANGQVVYTQTNVNSRAVTLDRIDLPTGLYFIKANFEEGTSVQRIMLD